MYCLVFYAFFKTYILHYLSDITWLHILSMFTHVIKVKIYETNSGCWCCGERTNGLAPKTPSHLCGNSRLETTNGHVHEIHGEIHVYVTWLGWFGVTPQVAWVCSNMVCSAKRVSLGEPSTTGYQAFSRLGTSKPPICWGGFNTSQPDFSLQVQTIGTQVWLKNT